MLPRRILPLLGFLSLPFCAAAAGQQATPNVWYTQLGQWHIIRDSTIGSSCLYHNWRRDGAVSGPTVSNIKLNRVLRGIRRIDIALSLDSLPAQAGFLVKSKRVTYHFLIERNRDGDVLAGRYLRDRHWEDLFRAPVARTGDTVGCMLTVKADSLVFRVGASRVVRHKPASFDSCTTIGIVCLAGAVHVWDVTIESADTTIVESFDHAGLVNLHLDKMFRNKQPSRTGNSRRCRFFCQ